MSGAVDVELRAKVAALHDAAAAECDRLKSEYPDAIARGPQSQLANERDWEQAWGRRVAFRQVLDLLNEGIR